MTARRLLALGATTALASASLTFGVGTLAATPAQAASCSGVWVVVDTDVRCATSYSNGLDALRSAGFSVQTLGGGFICRIEGTPATCTASVPYWVYVHSERQSDGSWGPWVYSDKGAGVSVPARDVAEGWVFGQTNDRPGAKPPTTTATSTSTRTSTTTQPPRPSSTSTSTRTTTSRSTTRTTSEAPASRATTQPPTRPATQRASAAPAAPVTTPDASSEAPATRATTRAASTTSTTAPVSSATTASPSLGQSATVAPPASASTAAAPSASTGSGAASTPAATPTDTPTAAATAQPEASPASASGSPLPVLLTLGALALAGGVLGAWLHRRKLG